MYVSCYFVSQPLEYQSCLYIRYQIKIIYNYYPQMRIILEGMLLIYVISRNSPMCCVILVSVKLNSHVSSSCHVQGSFSWKGNNVVKVLSCGSYEYRLREKQGLNLRRGFLCFASNNISSIKVYRVKFNYRHKRAN